MSLQIKTIEDVVNYQLCTGCGACAAAEPQRYEMHDVRAYGKRPKLVEQPVAEAGVAFKVCPGHQLEHPDYSNTAVDKSLLPVWGPVLEVWEGYAVDEQIRFRGSSGGASTALSLFALEQKNAGGILHTAASTEQPTRNATVLSQTREQLLARTGSRYAPASPCDGALSLLDLDAPGVFVGKPCDVAAITNLIREKPEFDSKVMVKIAFFCAGTPSTEGNEQLMRNQGFDDIDAVTSLKFRGEGWPGMWRVTNAAQEREMTYADSWGFLQRFRQWRCYICPDHSGEFADIAVGDPWYREIEAGENGSSLIVVRTERGRQFLQEAVAAGYIAMVKQEKAILPGSQKNLINARGALWGRGVALKLAGAAFPEYRGFETFSSWWKSLTLKEKLQSLVGTLKRVKRKKLNQRLDII